MPKLDFSSKPQTLGKKTVKKEEVSLNSDENTVVEIPTSLIDIGENIRNEKTDTDLEQLADSIKEYGQLQPILVYKNGERYTAIIGSRRTKACMLYDIPTIKCIVVPEIKKDKERIILQAIENEQRNNMTPKERESYMKQLLDLGLTQIEIAKVLHKPKSWISECLKALSTREDNAQIFNSLDKEPSTRTTYTFGNLNEDQKKQVQTETEENGNTEEAFEKAVKKAKDDKKKKESEIQENKEESYKNVDERFNIDNDDSDFSIDFDDSEIEEENDSDEKTYGIHITYGLNEESKKFLLHSDVDSFDSDIEKFVLKQIENYYLEKGYIIEK